MIYRSYQHVERLGTTETNGILDGTCYISPKIDGLKKFKPKTIDFRELNRRTNLQIKAVMPEIF